MEPSRAPVSDRALDGVALAAGASLFAPFAWLLATRRVLTQFDLAWFSLPLRFLYHRALAAGDTVLWTPSIFAGFYVQGDGQAGLTHPLHWALYRWLPLTAAFDLESAVSYAIAFCGTFVLLRRVALTRAAALMGAMLFAFSGFNLLHYCHMNAVAVVAHVPWMLAALDVMLRSPRRRDASAAAAAYALLAGSQILDGYPQYVWITLLISAAWAGIRTTRPRRIALAGAALLLGGAVGAAQLLPNFEALAESSRGGMGTTFALSYSLHPLNLLQLWEPYAFASRAYLLPGEVEALEFGFYNSAFCTAALAWLYIRRRDLGPHRRLAAGLAVAAAAFTVLSFGRFGVVGRLVAYLPVVGVFRAPARQVAAVHLCLAALGAIAFDDLARLQRSGRTLPPRDLVPLGAVVVLSGCTFALRLVPLGAFHTVLPFLAWSAPRHAAVGVAFVSITCAAVAFAARGARSALAGLLVVVAADLGLWGWTYAWVPAPQTIPAIAATAWTPAGAQAGATLYEDYGVPAANLPVLRGFRMFNGYVGMWPVRALPLESLAAQRLGGTDWRHDALGWHRVADPMPRARLVADVRTSADISRDIDAIDIARTALVTRPAGTFEGDAGRASVLVDRPGRIAAGVIAPGRQLLVLTERFHAGWRATVDGAEAETVRADGDQLGVPVARGAHTVELTFSPAGARAGLLISVASVIGLVAGLLGARYSRGADEG